MKDFVKRLNLRLGYSTYKRFPRGSTHAADILFNGKPITAIEVGVARGWNAESILKTLNIKKLYLIDDYNRNNPIEYTGMGDWEGEAKSLLKKYQDQIEFIKMKSIKAKDRFTNNSIDFVYIDASHLYKNVMRDLYAYYPKVRKGGILAGHDIGVHQEVMDAVIAFVKEKDLKLTIKGEDWIIIK